MFGLSPTLIAGCVAVAMAAGGAIYWKGRTDGRAVVAVEAVKETAAAYEKRNKIDENIRDLDRVGLCVKLGGVRSDCAAGLSGVAQDQH